MEYSPYYPQDTTVFGTMNLKRHLIEMLFPDKCVGCFVRGVLLCDECRKNIAPALQPPYQWITSIFSYNDTRTKALVRLLKYRNAPRVVGIFAPTLAEAFAEFLGEENLFIGSRNILLVPIPLSKNRLRKRGYNQAELLAKAIASRFPGKAIVETTLLKKRIETKPQAEIRKRSLRLQNLGDCFWAENRHAHSGEIIVLLDDVTTTGATLVAARKALRAAGYRRIYALTIAH